MLVNAKNFETQLRIKFNSIAYDLKYQYYFIDGYYDEFYCDKNTWNGHEFAILNGDREVIGYISYSINQRSNKAYGLSIINFSEKDKDIICFGKGLHTALDDIFVKYKFRKLNYSVGIGNPIESQYDKLTNKYGGRIIGVKKEDSKLLNGEYCDLKMYEIFRDDYLKHKKIRECLDVN